MAVIPGVPSNKRFMPYKLAPSGYLEYNIIMAPYEGKTKHLKAWVCPYCKRPLPIDRFHRRKRKRRGKNYVFYEVWACRQCQASMYAEKARERARRNYWDRQREKQSKLNNKRAKRRKTLTRRGLAYRGQKTFLSKAECLPCTQCGSLGPKYKNDSWCQECTRFDAKKRRDHRKQEDPAWHAEQLARLKAWKKENPNLASGTRSYHGYFTPAQWEATKEAFSNLCAYCGGTEVNEQGGDFERDHVVSWANGGRYVIGNIAPACPTCNQSKSSHPLRSWLNDEQRYEAILTSLGDAEWLCQQ